MFYVYGSDGTRFAGTLENLGGGRRVDAVRASGAAGPGDRETGRGTPGREAVEAYRRDIGWQERPEPVLHASGIMSAPLVRVPKGASLAEAAELMRARRIRHLPVEEAGRLAGIVSERDILRRLAGGGDASGPVDAIMASPVVAADPRTDIRRMAHAMCESRLGCMPIVDADGTPVGMVTRSDILRALMHHPSLSLRA